MRKKLVKFRSVVRQYVYRYLHRDVFCKPCARQLFPTENKIGHLYRQTEHRIVEHNTCAKKAVPNTITMYCFCGESFDVRTITLETRFLAHVYTCLFGKPMTKSLMEQYRQLDSTECTASQSSQSMETDSTMSFESTVIASSTRFPDNTGLVNPPIPKFEDWSRFDSDPVLRTKTTADAVNLFDTPSTSSASNDDEISNEEYVRRWAEATQRSTEYLESESPSETSSSFRSSNATSTTKSKRRPRRRTVAELKTKACSVAFNRLITRYAIYLGLKFIKCRTCEERVASNSLLAHGKLHTCTVNGFTDVTYCVSCDCYLFYVGTSSILRAQLYYHTLVCLQRSSKNVEDHQHLNSNFMTQFVELVRRHALSFVEDGPAFERTFVRRDLLDVDRLPNWNTYQTFVLDYSKRCIDENRRRLREAMAKVYSTNDSETLIDASFDFISMFDNDHGRRVDENTLNMTRQNDYVSDENVSYLNVEHCNTDEVFHCAPEISRLRAASRLDERNFSASTLETFYTNKRWNEKFCTRPHWLLDALKSVYSPGQHDHLDPNLCGLSVWLLALAKLLPTSSINAPDVPNKFSFCHVFLYERAATYSLKLLADSSKCYVLPNTCLCYDTASRPDETDNLHRHFVCIFVSRSARTSFVRRVAASTRRKTTANSVPGIRRKTQYCLSILTKHHYFNVVNYVSRNKINSRTADNTSFHEAVLRSTYEGPNDSSSIVVLPRVVDSLTRVGSKDYDFLPVSVRKGDTSSLRSLVERTNVINERKEQLEDLDDARDDDNEEETIENNSNEDEDDESRERFLNGHTKNGEHVYIKEPVCSHFLDLVSVTYSTGLTELLSRKPLTPQIVLDLATKSRMVLLSSLDRRPKRRCVEVESHVIRFNEIRGLIGCNLSNHVIPYKNLTRLRPEQLVSINRYFYSLGMFLTEDQIESGLLLTVYDDFGDVDVILPLVAMSRSFLAQNLFTGQLNKIRELTEQVERSNEQIRVQQTIIDEFKRIIENLIDDENRTKKLVRW